jgi:hypothetical protein
VSDLGVETLRPLLPVGYAAGADAYRAAVAGLTAHDLSTHYTAGLDWFQRDFVPHVKRVLEDLSGGAWDLSGFDAFAAGSDVDFMTHLVEAVAAREEVCLYPGDWFGFRVGCTHPERATLTAPERRAVAQRLTGILDKTVLSISFSRGFGLTASQLGLALVPHDHPYRRRFAGQWQWLSYFHNALAARAFQALDVARLQAVDEERRAWVHAWLRRQGLPVVPTGSYYVKAFRPTDGVPDELQPLAREGLVRHCFKPPQT